MWLRHPFLDKVVSVKGFCVRWLQSRANYRCGNHDKDQKEFFFLNDERRKEKNNERKREASETWRQTQGIDEIDIAVHDS